MSRAVSMAREARRRRRNDGAVPGRPGRRGPPTPCSAATPSRGRPAPVATRRASAAGGLAGNEDYWSQIQRCFDTDRTLINFNNGGVSPSPTHVLDQMIRDLRFCNELPAYHMWQVLEPRIETVRRDLAQQFGCDPEELAITRNASEGMETLILGVDLKRGRRGDRHRPELSADAHHLGPAGPPRGDRRQVGLVPDPARRRPASSSSASARRSRRGPASSSSPTSRTSAARSCRCATWCGWPASGGSSCSSTAPTRSPISRSPATSSTATSSPPACTSGCWPRSAPGFLYVRKAQLKTIWPLMAAPVEHG